MAVDRPQTAEKVVIVQIRELASKVRESAQQISHMVKGIAADVLGAPFGAARSEVRIPTGVAEVASSRFRHGMAVGPPALMRDAFGIRHEVEAFDDGWTD